MVEQPVEVVNDSDAEATHRREEEVVETVRRWGQAVTTADHRAIYASSGRDYNGWLERQGEKKVS